MIIKLKNQKDKWTFFVGQMDLSKLIFFRSIGSIHTTFDLLYSDNYQDSRGEGGGAYICDCVNWVIDGTIRDQILVENLMYSPHIRYVDVGGDNYQDFRCGGVGYI